MWWQSAEGELCFVEVDIYRAWHRDVPHDFAHHLGMRYLQLMVFLSDVGEGTHCFSVSPESAYAVVDAYQASQLLRGGRIGRKWEAAIGVPIRR